MIARLCFLQEEKLNNLGIDSQNAIDFQRPYKFSGKLEDENIQKNSQENHTGNSSSEETHKSLSFVNSLQNHTCVPRNLRYFVMNLQKP